MEIQSETSCKSHNLINDYVNATYSYLKEVKIAPVDIRLGLRPCVLPWSRIRSQNLIC